MDEHGAVCIGSDHSSVGVSHQRSDPDVRFVDCFRLGDIHGGI